ncbi:glycosyltransferase family 32 protein [Mesoflavibacter zeaxanthinifaciens]|uniref:glycosyltransferase family 32 protein n=1 Tax=Mesoflavibacter zeaxanthinifaciens TaxID=393060 RepID=UPI000400DBB5|nr:glycosyltransferase [Mesoflavibacter zeaxanthinifaciens]
MSSNTTLIPKKIHYCWFGKQPKPQLIIDCIKSWTQFCPDFECIEWNEDNADLSHSFVASAYTQKKWAFVSDYVRLTALYTYGGIYLDTDMMLIDGFAPFLKHSCFFGAEEPSIISAGIIGCVKHHPLIGLLIKRYDSIQLDAFTNYNTIAIPLIITNTVKQVYGKAVLNIDKVTKLKEDLVIYPQDYFYPFPNKDKANIANYLEYKTENTVAIHLWNASWVVYNEFDFLLKKKYLKALPIILNRIFIKRDFNTYYFKRLYNHLKY